MGGAPAASNGSFVCCKLIAFSGGHVFFFLVIDTRTDADAAFAAAVSTAGTESESVIGIVGSRVRRAIHRSSDCDGHFSWDWHRRVLDDRSWTAACVGDGRVCVPELFV